MRISDWSSDVCSADLVRERHDLRRRHVDAAAQIILLHRRDQIGAAGTGAIFEPPVDERDGEELEIEPPRVLDRVQALDPRPDLRQRQRRSEEHTSELQSLMRISYAVFCLKKTTKR